MYSNYEWQYYRERHQQMLKIATEARLANSIIPTTASGPSFWRRLINRLRRQSKQVFHDYVVIGR